jgi:hypothetical protein
MAACDFTPVGSTFHKLTVVGSPIRARTEQRWHVMCRCECGTETLVMCKLLVGGHSKSCGCIRGHKGESATQNVKHGLAHGPEWRVYYSMLHRCYKPQNKVYAEYGGRGIKVCDRWRESFEAFVSDMGPRPEGMTLDRYPDVNGNYEPENCRWATPKEQANNRRNNVYLDAFGERLTVAEWSAKTGIGVAVLRARIKYGWSAERLLSEPIAQRAP